MHYIRRTLLCLVVGVIAFGVAGWGFRPKPSWEIEISSKAYFEYSAEARSKDDPILLSVHDDEFVWLESEIIALAPDTGDHLQTFRPPKGFYFRRELLNLTDGRLLASADLPMLKERTNFLRTCFAVIDPKRRTCERERILEGEWKAVAGGESAWMVTSITDGFKLVFKNLSDGTKIKELEFPKGYGRYFPFDVTVSPDGRFLVICESIKDPPSTGFEIWNIDEKKLVRRVDLPTRQINGEPLRAASPRFESGTAIRIDGRRASDVEMPTGSWTFDVERLEFVVEDRWSPAPPANDPPLETQANKTQSGATIWTAFNLTGGPFGWFSVYQDRERIREWRKVPFQYQCLGYMGGPYGTIYGMNVDEVPCRDEFVALIWHPPLKESLPEFLHGIVGTFFEIELVRDARYWHDGKSGAWRDIGCHGSDHTQIRENALLCIRKSDDGRRILQSWPLPPRDPKWPALGVAALCVAATWWVCAKRYARRLRLAA